MNGSHDRMRIGVIGAGAMGRLLARKLRQSGHAVCVAGSKGPEWLRALGRELDVSVGSPQQSVDESEVVVLAIPTKAVTALPARLFDGCARSTVVVDVGNYHPELRDGRIDAIERGMLDSEWTSAQIGRPVVKAFNSIVAESLSAKGVPRGTKLRIALPVAGDSAAAKACVLRLVDELGFDGVDAGELSDCWRQQTGAPAYCRDLEAPALREALAAADRSRIGQYRAEREAQLQRRMRSHE